MKNVIIASLLTTSLISGGSLGYHHLKKDITLVVNDKKVELSTFTDNVEELLKEQQIKYDQNDIINTSLDTKLEDGMNIEIVDVVVNKMIKSKKIDFETEVVMDENRYKGEEVVSTEGEQGQNELVYEITYHNGKQVEKKLVYENIVKKPVNKVIKKGTKEKEVVKEVKKDVKEVSKVEEVKNEQPKEDIKNDTKEVSNLGTHMVVESTAYYQGTVTATGTTPKWGTIAVDPNVIPFGTKVYIPQFDKVFVAEDTGSAIKGNKIDIFMDGLESSLNWGRRNIDIYILK